jgi:hypothetical protein
MEKKYASQKAAADSKSPLDAINNPRIYLQSAEQVMAPDDTPEPFGIEELPVSCGMPLLDLAPKNLERNCLTDSFALVRTTLLYIKQAAAIAHSVYKVLCYNGQAKGYYSLERFLSSQRASVEKVHVQHRGYRRSRNSRQSKLIQRAAEINSYRSTELKESDHKAPFESNLIDPLFVSTSPGTRRRSPPSSRVAFGDLKQYQPPEWFTVFFRTIDELHNDETIRLTKAKYNFQKTLACTDTMPFKEFTPVSDDSYHRLRLLYHAAVYCRWNLLQGLDDMESLPTEQLNDDSDTSPFRRFILNVDKFRVICFEFRLRLSSANVVGSMANYIRTAYLDVDSITSSKVWIENLTKHNEQRFNVWVDANGLTGDDVKVMKIYPPVQILAYALLEQFSGTTPCVVCTDISAEPGVTDIDFLRDQLVLTVTIRTPLQKRKSKDDHSWTVYLAMDSALIGVDLSCRLTMMVSYDNQGLITLGTIRVNKYKALKCASHVVGYILERDYSPASFESRVAKPLNMVYASDQESAFGLEFGAYLDVVEKLSDEKFIAAQIAKQGGTSTPVSGASAVNLLFAPKITPATDKATAQKNVLSASSETAAKPPLNTTEDGDSNATKRKATEDPTTDDDDDLPA